MSKWAWLGRTIRRYSIHVLLIAIVGAVIYVAPFNARSWLDAMIRQYGVQLLFTVARVIGFGLSMWLTVVVVNWYRDRDERRNVDEKARRIIAARTAERDRWRAQCKAIERVAARRRGAMRAALPQLSGAMTQLVGDGEDPDNRRKVRR